jgi:glycoside/pentoside/hexuronide:cation symporter, GPH family
MRLNNGDKLSAWALVRLGLPALPLAFVALPLYVLWPHYFATQYGVALSLIGGLLLLARALDAVIDPSIGHWLDKLYAHSPQRVLRRCWLAALMLALSFVGLFFPQWLLGREMAQADLLVLVGALLLVCYLSFSVLTIALQAWGARMGGDSLACSRLVGWREGLGLAGVVLASLVSGLAGIAELVSVFVGVLILAMLSWSSAVQPAPSPPHQGGWWSSLWKPWQDSAFLRLLGVFMVNGIASAIPATLIVFFVQDRLQLGAEMQAQFLGTYFVAAALSMPLWLRLIARFGLSNCWAAGMALAIAVFIWSLALGAGDVWGYTAICALSGLALGADLIAPGALLNGVLQSEDKQHPHAGAYFGWWQVATKLNLALAAGVALPLLEWLGYTPGAQDAPALAALSWSYALLPCALKCVALLLLLLLKASRLPLKKESV